MIVINGKFLAQPFSGVQRYSLEITRHLVNISCEKIQIITPFNQGQEKEFLGINAVISSSFTQGAFWEQFELPIRLNRLSRPYLLNLGNTAPLIYDRNIVTNHGLAWKFFPEAYSKKFLLWYEFLIPKILKKANLVITVSHSAKEEIVDIFRIPDEKIEVIYPGVSGIFVPGSYERRNFILYVGNLQNYKNIQTLLKAVKLLIEDGVEIELYVVGSTDNRVFKKLQSGRDFTSVDNRVKFLGFKRDAELVSLYQEAICLVLPSLYESFGLPMLEAMACGCPVIASDLQSLREVGQDAVIFFNPYDPCDLATKIKDLLNDDFLKLKMSQKGINLARSFRWDVSAEKLRRILKDRFMIEL